MRPSAVHRSNAHGLCSKSSTRVHAGISHSAGHMQQRAVRCTAAAPTWVPPADVVTQSDAERIQELQLKFQMYDADGNGTLDREEVSALLQSTAGGLEVPLQNWMGQEEVDRIFDLYDKDHNGTLSFEEFTKMVYDNVLLEGKLAEYYDAFNTLDFTGNGYLSATEVATLFSNLNQPLSYEKLVDLFSKYDKDASGEIDFQEFLYMFHDKLLDLQAVLQYIRSDAAMDKKTFSEEEDLSGQVQVIFHSKELDHFLKTDEYVAIFAALTWCRPCKAMQRPYQKMAAAYPNVTFLKLFGNANPSTKLLFKDQLRIRSTPSFLLYRNGELVASCSGAKKEKWETQLWTNLPEDQRPAPLFINPEEVLAAMAAAPVVELQQ